MQSKIQLLVFPAIVAAVLLTAAAAYARTEEETIRAAHDVLQQFRDLQIRQIPDSLLAEAHGVAIIPNVIKLGLVVGGQRGKGVVVIRERDGSWRAPLFVTITGGSIGWQVGAQSTDFMLVFKSQKSVDGLLRGKFTLGADAAVAAGPVGRRAGAATDAELKAEIYSYSRSRGLFAGVSLEGSALQVDDTANSAYYGASTVGGAPLSVPASALKLVEIIAGITNHGTVAPASLAPGESSQGSDFVAPGGNPVLSGQPQPMNELQTKLARSATELSPLLDAAWREHLALPAEVFEPGRRPPSQSIEAALARFNAVARNRQYHALSDRPQFHQTHQLLQAYYEDLRASAAQQIGLPPPPASRP